MLTITNRDDLEKWLRVTRSDIHSAFGEEGIEVVLETLQDENHPAFGTDWEEWLQSEDTKEIIEDTLSDLDDEEDDLDEEDDEDLGDEDDDEDEEDEDEEDEEADA